MRWQNCGRTTKLQNRDSLETQIKVPLESQLQNNRLPFSLLDQRVNDNSFAVLQVVLFRMTESKRNFSHRRQTKNAFQHALFLTSIWLPNHSKNASIIEINDFQPNKLASAEKMLVRNQTLLENSKRLSEEL